MVQIPAVRQRERQVNTALKELRAAQTRGRVLTPSDRVHALRKLTEMGRLQTLEPLLPLFLNLKGFPYTLAEHYPFAPFFRTRRPTKSIWKTGRQVSKSTSMAADGVLLSNAIPHFQTLYVMPLYEQVRRFSANYVRPFIDQSPAKSLWTGTNTENSVLQRSFKNLSRMIFSFALLDADRVRGVTSDKIAIDEIQDMDRDHLPIILETMSYSKYGVVQYTGTPKTFDNTIHEEFESSSQAEWFVPCFACGKWNIPAMAHDLDRMIGPMRDDISKDNPGTICAKCRRPINPAQGRWVHRYPERVLDYAGYHVPQIIMPHHYGTPKMWASLIGKQNTIAPNLFWNEVLGESYDMAQKIISQTELKAACSLPFKNTPDEITPGILARAKHYQFRILSVDWGGGGEKGVSYTACAVLGFLPTGKIDVLWGKRLMTPHAHVQEAKELKRIFQAFNCHMIAHDYTGAGTIRETVLMQQGLSAERIMPVTYVRAASANILNFVEATAIHPRNHYRMDKTRALLYVCTAIKLGLIRFFDWDYKNKDHPGLIADFLNLVENKVDSKQGSDIYTIHRSSETVSDDWAQAVTIGTIALWHIHAAYPNFGVQSERAALPLTKEAVKVAGDRDHGWEQDPDLAGYLDPTF